MTDTMPTELETMLREMGVREPLIRNPVQFKTVPPHHPDIAAWIRNPTGEPPF